VNGLGVDPFAQRGSLACARGVGPREYGRHRAAGVIEAHDAVEEARDAPGDHVISEMADRRIDLVERLTEDVHKRFVGKSD
jgi:hypothetical protein